MGYPGRMCDIHDQNSLSRNFTTTELVKLKKQFNAFDCNGAGTVPSKKLLKMMKSFGFNPNEHEIMDTLNKIDIDGDGKISFREMLMMLSPTDEELNDDIILGSLYLKNKIFNFY